MSDIRIERTYAHPREKVWRAVTTAELLARWLMPNDFEPTVGHRFTFTTDPAPGFDGIVRCEVTEVREPERVAFTWVGGPVDTLVTITLDEVEGGTRLVMVQSGFRGLKSRLVGLMLKSGCGTLYGKRLPEVLADMDGTGVSTAPDDDCMSRGQGVIRRLLAWFER